MTDLTDMRLVHTEEVVQAAGSDATLALVPSLFRLTLINATKHG